MCKNVLHFKRVSVKVRTFYAERKCVRENS